MNKIAKIAATAAIVLAIATPAFASSHKTVTVTKVKVENTAHVENNVATVSNSGLNQNNVSGGKTVGGDTHSGNASKGGETGDTTGGATIGGNEGTLSTGNAHANTGVSNVVNTTVVSFE